MMLVNLGVKDFGNFKFWFIINSDWQGWGLNTIRNQIWSCWIQHREMENWVYSGRLSRMLRNRLCLSYNLNIYLTSISFLFYFILFHVYCLLGQIPMSDITYI